MICNSSHGLPELARPSSRTAETRSDESCRYPTLYPSDRDTITLDEEIRKHGP